MTISRVKPANWSNGEKLSSPQLNQIDTNTAAALDKRSGQTDTLESVVSCSGAGRIITSYATGPDANATYLASGANSVIVATSLTSHRAYTLSATNAVVGDRIVVANAATTHAINVVNGPSGATILRLSSSIGLDGLAPWGEFIWTGSNWILLRSSLPSELASIDYTANSAWQCPSVGVTHVMLTGWGGGGGGGGGGLGSTATGVSALGGSGGGGAQLITAVVAVTPNTAYTITIGNGGTGGSANSPGSDGGDTTFGSLFTAKGGGGGWGGGSLPLAFTHFVAGGSPVAITYSAGFRNSATQLAGNAMAVQLAPGAGAAGWNSNSQLAPSCPSSNGNAGGTSGSYTGSSGAYNGGGGGGGGGGGAGGPGANGGNGGGANSAGAGLAGAAGTSATANSGAGGGGGGGGGNGSASAGSAGIGGNGGSGRLRLTPLR